MRSVESSLKAAIDVEEAAKSLVDLAIQLREDEKLPVRIAAYNKAREGRMHSERLVQEHLENSRVLVRLDDAKALIRRAWPPLVSRLRGIAKNCAHLANPENDVLAEEVIRLEIEKAITEASAEYEHALCE